MKKETQEKPAQTNTPTPAPKVSAGNPQFDQFVQQIMQTPKPKK